MSGFYLIIFGQVAELTASEEHRLGRSSRLWIVLAAVRWRDREADRPAILTATRESERCQSAG
jgi:hypothetical protein